MAVSINNRLTSAIGNSAQETATESDLLNFDEQFKQHYGRVFGLLFRLLGNRVEAEDITQEVFLKLYQRPPQNVTSAEQIGAWLYRVAVNTGYNAVRGRQRRWQRNVLLVPKEHDDESNPERMTEQAESTARVRAALATLKPQDAQILLLRQMGLSYAELAAACDMNVNSVGKRLSRAAAAFRVAFEQEDATTP